MKQRPLLPRLRIPAWVWQAAALTALVSLTYLPNLAQAGVYVDGWYYVLDRIIGGPRAFFAMFAIDRPLRGYLFEAFHQLFGYQPFPYHLSAYLFRLGAGFAAWWLFSLLWPKQRAAAFWGGVLAALYPGYAQWLEGYETQPHVISFFLQTLSIALTLRAIQARKVSGKIMLWSASILTGWTYLGLVEYALGMEAFRWLCVGLLVSHQSGAAFLKMRAGTWKKIGAFLKAVRLDWALSLLIPAGFLAWRFLFFQNTRIETNLGAQLAVLLSDPLLRGVWWLVSWGKSALYEGLFAWTAPRFSELFSFNLTSILLILLQAAGAAGIGWLALFFQRQFADSGESESRLLAWTADGGESESRPLAWTAEALLLGAVGVILGVLPVIVANRSVNLDAFSHYALPASLASCLLPLGLIGSLQGPRLRRAALASTVFLAALTHGVISARTVADEQTISAFWHQVVWRAPQIQRDTTLLVHYPGLNIGENSDMASGPAVFLYYPQTTNTLPAYYPLPALSETAQTASRILSGQSSTYGYRTHTGSLNFDRLLILTQPSGQSCVHVVDGSYPLITENDPDRLKLLAERSKIAAILPDAVPPVPEASVFGPEPAHNWCYYYQKAELALQRGEPEQVVALGAEAMARELHPLDSSEWQPFLMAYARLGLTEDFKAVATRINGSLYDRLQVCRNLKQFEQDSGDFDPQVREHLAQLVCWGK